MSQLEQNMSGLQNILEVANSISTEVDTQTDLISQIMMNLGGNSISGGSGNIGGVDGVDISPFSQIIIGTITPTTDMYTFTIPSKNTDSVVLFAMMYVGPGNVLNKNGFSDTAFLSSTTTNASADIYDYGEYSSITNSYIVATNKTMVSGNIVTFDSSYRPQIGCEYAYIALTRTERSYVITSSNGSN